MKLKIIKIGNSAGVILPKTLLEHLGVGVGETILATTTEAGVLLTATSRSTARLPLRGP